MNFVKFLRFWCRLIFIVLQEFLLLSNMQRVSFHLRWRRPLFHFDISDKFLWSKSHFIFWRAFFFKVIFYAHCFLFVLNLKEIEQLLSILNMHNSSEVWHFVWLLACFRNKSFPNVKRLWKASSLHLFLILSNICQTKTNKNHKEDRTFNFQWPNISYSIPFFYTNISKLATAFCVTNNTYRWFCSPYA